MSSKLHRQSLDTLLLLVAHHHRRQLILYFAESANETATIDELVTHLTETRPQSGEISHGSQQVGRQLYHEHLPRLEDAGLIEWDAHSETVRYYPDGTVERLLYTIRPLADQYRSSVDERERPT